MSNQHTYGITLKEVYKMTPLLICFILIIKTFEMDTNSPLPQACTNTNDQKSHIKESLMYKRQVNLTMLDYTFLYSSFMLKKKSFWGFSNVQVFKDFPKTL